MADPSSPDKVTSEIVIASPQRRGTVVSDGGSDRTDTCRICRSDGTPDEPLFHPCKCSGSIKFVHQECLMEWLSHSHKKHCELCKTPFRFTKLYDAAMPPTLPWTVFVRRAGVHAGWFLARACRALLVAAVWMVVLPWAVRSAWRYMFCLADASWAREAFVQTMQSRARDANQTTAASAALPNTFSQYVNTSRLFNSSLDEPRALGMARDLLATFGFDYLLSSSAGSGSHNYNRSSTSTRPPIEPSMLSSWTYISQMTSDPRFNRIILDLFEGQLITCVVITGFILVFLIREWVVQQQPPAHLGNVELLPPLLQDGADMAQTDNDRLQRQQELLEHARQRLTELQAEVGARDEGEAASHAHAPTPDFIGWEALERLIDDATAQLRNGGEAEHDRFLSGATTVAKQIRAASDSDVTLDGFTDRLFKKLAGYDEEERGEWEAVLVSEIEQSGLRKTKEKHSRSDIVGVPPTDRVLDQATLSESPEGSAGSRRPPMPDRDFSSRATQIQRLLEEAEGTFTPNDPSTPSNGMLRMGESNDRAGKSGLPDLPPDSEERLKPLADEDMPITNAGPDAKTNIRRSGKHKARAVPSPEETKTSLLSAEEQKSRREQNEALARLEEEIKKEDAAASSVSRLPGEAPNETPANLSAGNPFHPDGPDPEPSNDGSVRGAVASVFREEFAVEAEELENLRQAGLASTGGTTHSTVTADASSQQRGGAAPNPVQKLADWFWGDIQPIQPSPEPVIAPDEERMDSESAEQDTPFVPVENGQPGIVAPEPQEPEERPEHDPEVVAAAAQAGLDAEAIEDAEDLEGILELVGLQGPLLGLLQTSTFCIFLVNCTVLGAVGLPYLWGKLVLSLIGSPTYFLVKMPLEIAGFIADLVIDLALYVSGWMALVLALAGDFCFSALEAWLPKLGGVRAAEWLEDFATALAKSSGTRLQNLFMAAEPAAGLGWKWAFLRASVHAHASLKHLGEETNAVFEFVGGIVSSTIDTLSSASVSWVWQGILGACTSIPDIPAKLLAGVAVLTRTTMSFMEGLESLRGGALTFETPGSAQLDPSLAYWSSTDRSLAVLTGYLTLAALAAVYVAMDAPITRSQSGQKTEKLVRDTLIQAGGVLKVILIISIEMLVFPLYCGLLLDLAFLPLFQDASVATRWTFATRHPSTFCFIHWFVGTCYMFHFALFVGMCRKILRKGVLWFIRDPDDPTFHPVRDVLERNVATQLRKIAFSALVYGALVILCLGGVIWTIGHVFEGIFPIHWISTEPVLEFPMDLLLYNAIVPIIVRLFRPSEAANALYAWWLRRCARLLRLSHFLFDDRRKDEEGHHVRRNWSAFFFMRKSELDANTEVSGEERLTEGCTVPEVYFQRDGKYVLTPCNDQYRPPKLGEAYLHTDEQDVYIVDKDGRKNDHFAKVYVPPFFRLRITLFMVCLWMFSAVAGLFATLVPLVFGRRLLALLVSQDVRVNDIYAYSAGAYILGGTIYAISRVRSRIQRTWIARDWKPTIDLQAWTRPMGRIAFQALKCGYVYGFIGVVLPVIFALLLQAYLILPLHTYTISMTAPSRQAFVAAKNVSWAIDAGSDPSPFPLQTPESPTLSTMANHTIHVLQDYCLGLLYVRMASRLVIATPTSRAAEAVRRITADGYLNPNARLATRFLFAPVVLVSTAMFLLPPLMAWVSLHASSVVGAPVVAVEARTKYYRYSYPVTASGIATSLGVMEMGKATSRWRARIRDEVYLVGERLHNFGEKRPPVGSRSVVRKEN